MLTNLYIRIAELAVTILLIAAIIFAWREARSDRAQLQSQLAAANQAVAAATTRQQDRDGKLTDVLDAIAKQKSSPATNDELIAGIAREANLPSALSQQTQPPTSAGVVPHASSRSADNSTELGTKGNQPPTNSLQTNSSATTSSSNTSRTTKSATNSAADLPAAPDVKIPAADLRPLYDYMLDCKACQARLSAAQADLADEKSKTATLAKSRDAAVKAAQGGSILQRTFRAAKWLALGAAAGAIAVKATR